MTANELIKYFNDTYNTLDKEWPETFEVDAETYANCCKAIFDYAKANHNYTMLAIGIWSLNIAVGRTNGLMFKNVELILKS